MNFEEEFNSHTLIYHNAEYEDEFQNSEKKSLNTFAFYSAYILMIIGWISAILPVAFGFYYYSNETFDTFHLALYFAITCFSLVGETLTFLINTLKKFRGLCLMVDIYILIALIIPNYDALIPTVPMYFLVLICRTISMLLLIEVFGSAYARSWIIIAVSSFISYVLIIIFCVISTMSNLCTIFCNNI